MNKKVFSSNQMLVINMIANATSFIVAFGINFFLSPYIVRTVGVEAYGFVGLANSFVSYASLATIALNALSGRFITIHLVEKQYNAANYYYSSVFLANCFLSLIILLIETVIWVKLDLIINIPITIVRDVKILFAALFLNCIVSTVGSVFGVSTFATNKLYLVSIRNIEAQVIRTVLLIVMFALFSPRVWYLGATTLFTGIYCLVFNIYYTRVLTPYLKIKLESFSFKIVWELISSGIWSLINRVGQLLLDGLDLLITNIFIDASSMGILSLSKTIPNMITSIVSSLVSVFSPNFTILYAKGEKEELIKSIKQAMKIMGVITNIPIIILIVCGIDFFQLWQPTQNAIQLQVLSVLSVACLIISGGINSIYNIFTVVNKLKANSLVVICSGLISALITFFLVRYSNLGVYAVAGTSTMISVFRNLLFTVPYGAICLDLKWYTFFPDLLKPAVYALISVVFCRMCIRILPMSGGWLMLLVKAMLTGVFSILIGVFIILDSKERKQLVETLKKHK